jgi:hypothetical protein
MSRSQRRSWPPEVADEWPDVHYASKVDGDRQSIVEASQFDMAGWSVEWATTLDTYRSPFVRRELPKSGHGRFSFVLGGDWVPVWVADGTGILVDPQSERHNL